MSIVGRMIVVLAARHRSALGAPPLVSQRAAARPTARRRSACGAPPLGPRRTARPLGSL